MKLKEIHRTSTFAWSPAASFPLLATGTVAGALDESLSNESQLEIWAPDFLDRDEFDLGYEGGNGPKGSVKDNARFNRLAWGCPQADHSQGVIAAGLENGELALWDPSKILGGASAAESLILRNTTHTGPVRGLDFNPIQNNLLASGGIGGEVSIWDLKDPTKPYSPTPGQRSTKLDEITSVAWNQQRGKRKVVALAYLLYGGGAGTLAGTSGPGAVTIAWQPDNATTVVTASVDDSSPIIMVWDLRNARAPEKILTGHEKGVLSLSCYKQDADLLLSCGKDNRALCWNPQTSEVIGELPSADNWAFQVDWCPRNPDMLATAFFDGTIGIHSLQSTNEPAADSKAAAPRLDGADIFDAPGFARSSSSQQGTLSLKQPPKWFRRPASSSFGFGGQLVTVSNLTSAQGKAQSSVDELVERAKKLQAAIANDDLKSFAEGKTEGEAATGEGWAALLSLFKANSRNELVTLLGFSKEAVAARVAEAVENLKASSAAKSETDDTTLYEKPHESVVSFAEPESQSQEIPSDRSDTGDESGSNNVATFDEPTPSDVDASAAPVQPEDEGSATTAPSLFGDDIPGTPQHDFFNTVGVAQDDGESHAVLVPHTNYGLDSSVAATVGSGPSSVTSEVPRSNSFRIYPTDESDVERLVTKALVLGDFESAVSLCLSADRFADAILLAVRGGSDLLQRTQKAYFERQTTTQPYLRLLQSIVSNDLSDIVQNTDLHEWREIFVVIWTFASQEELQEQFNLAVESNAEDGTTLEQEAYNFMENVTLTYLAAACLERLVGIWADELVQEEKALVNNAQDKIGSYYWAHAHSLQTFIEKYAELLCTQGLVKEAVDFLKLTPEGYKGENEGVDFEAERKRLVQAAAPGPVASTSKLPAASTSSISGTTRAPAYAGYNPYTAPRNHNLRRSAAQPPPPPGYTNVQAPPPPRAANGPATTLPPPPKRGAAGGWNDAPEVTPPSRAPAAITSPFPNSNVPATPGFLPSGTSYMGQPSATLPPPPRPGSVNRGGSVGPPPPQGHKVGGPPSAGVYPPLPGGSQPPSILGGVQPHTRLMSPPHGMPPAAAPARQPTPSQHMPPQAALRGPSGTGATPPPGQVHHHRSSLDNPKTTPWSLWSPSQAQQPHQPPPPPSGPYAPPQQQRVAPTPGPQMMQQQQQQQPGGPPPPGGPAGPPRVASRTAAPARAAPPPPKYPFEILNTMKQTVPPNQKRLVDDLEKRINPLFDALNCETLSRPVVDQLTVLTRAMDAHDRPAALAIHVELLTRGSQTYDIGLWLSGITQLIMRL
ncbi:hypothetical protein CPC08DRAFT_738561 [Agrocybe pediades]|nr:hypothetical protein CPC08DRAFT_738561 [Agrocybe pediades]